tara:strand:- start:2618 stop:3541 length:924 start_codon:yes stop_codon:yes gene_type:complete
MIKKITFLSLIFFIISSSFAKSSIYISVTVDNEIITNVDIEKESSYLKILNPKLLSLNDNQIFDIAKNSLINEVVKKKEIDKYLDLKKKDDLDNKLIKDLCKKLQLNQEQLKDTLKQKKSYTINEVIVKLRTNIFWNDLIYFKFHKQVRVNEDELKKKIEVLSLKENKEYLLSEIIFEKKKDQNLDDYINNIKSSISEIGFNNTANIYSISDSANFGGQIGWVSEANLSEIILKKLKNIEEGQFSEVIQVGNSYMLLMVEKIRLKKISLNKQNEFEKMIKFETNRQLNNFSKIFFNKSIINYDINEN